MRDERNIKLAKNIIEYSIELQKGEKLFISIEGEDGLPLALELMKLAYEIGAKPYYDIMDYRLMREMLLNANEEQVLMWKEHDLLKMKDADCYVGISACENRYELSRIPIEKMQLYTKEYLTPVHLEERVKNTRWCILRYPNCALAQSSKMSMEEFEEFYYHSCNVDYYKLSKAADALVELMNKTDKVHIIGKDTDLSFSIKGIGAQKYVGKLNLPDGEVASAPVRDSVNGYITYNTESRFNGGEFANIYFEFKDGKIVKATSNDTEKLNKLLDIDEGARYIGEFAFGLNPYIEKPIGDVLFDEKVKGSFHFTPGECLKESDNGNHSSIHWDIVCIQTSDYGGGEIFFDDVLIRKDGEFVLDELKPLNSENLK